MCSGAFTGQNFPYFFHSILFTFTGRERSAHQHMLIGVGAYLPNLPCQLSLWEETGVPAENP